MSSLQKPARNLSIISFSSAALLSYLTFIVYSSLFPFPEWRNIEGAAFSFLSFSTPQRIEFSDVLSNLLAYIPLGYLLTRVLRERHLIKSPPLLMLIATLLGGMLSFGVETTQQFLPGRVAALIDLFANGIGTTVGAALAVSLQSGNYAARFMLKLRECCFVEGAIPDLALGVIGLWTLSQLVPFVPSLDWGTIRHGLSPLWRTLTNPGSFDLAKCFTYAMSIAGLAMICRIAGKEDQPVMAGFFVFIAAVLLSKIIIVTRELSLEAIAGASAAATLSLPLALLGRRICAVLGILFVAAAFTAAELSPGQDAAAHSFNWMPLQGQLNRTLIGISSILEAAWPAAAMAFLMQAVCGFRYRVSIAWSGGIALAAGVFGLEWYQQFLPGRNGDFTMVLLATLSWAAVWKACPRPANLFGAGGEPSVGSPLEKDLFAFIGRVQKAGVDGL